MELMFGFWGACGILFALVALNMKPDSKLWLLVALVIVWPIALLVMAAAGRSSSWRK